MKIVTFGEIMLRLTPVNHQRFVQADSFNATYGGAEANVAVSLSCLGADTEFITKLPQNDIAQAAINSLRRYGVGTGHIVRGGNRMGLYYLESGASVRPSKVIYDRAGSSFSCVDKNDFDWAEILDGAAHLHLTGISPVLGKNVADVCLDACKAARDAGITVSFDPNYRSALWSEKDAALCLRRILPYTDILICNENQACSLFGFTPDDSMRDGEDLTDDGYTALSLYLRDLFGLKAVALTERRTYSSDINRFGGKLFCDGKLYSSRKYTINIVDRVGAGDAFAAGLIYAISNGYGCQEAIDFATAAGCIKHTIPGDCSICTKDEISAFIHSPASLRTQR